MPSANDSEALKDSEVKPTLQVPQVLVPALPRPRRKHSRHFFLWTLFALLIASFLWLATSSNPFAEGFQEFAGNKHDQAIVDVPFSVSPHNFRYYKFSLPEASTNVAVVGDFSVLPETITRKKTDSKHQQPPAEETVEVYVLSDSAFAIWQTGYTTSSVYQSGRVSQGKLQADLPRGGGVYYLVFSNKFSSAGTRKIDATIVLHYKSWIPEWIRAINIDW
jgi:hypothetical protein